MKIARQYYPTSKFIRKLYSEAAYAEVSYTDILIDESGRAYTSDGTEDFSRSRWIHTVQSRTIYTPTGELDRGGHRRWEAYATITCSKVSGCRIAADLLMSGSEYQLRKH